MEFILQTPFFLFCWNDLSHFGSNPFFFPRQSSFFYEEFLNFFVERRELFSYFLNLIFTTIIPAEN